MGKPKIPKNDFDSQPKEGIGILKSDLPLMTDEVKIVTDVRFYDSALFMYLFYNIGQYKNIKLNLIQTDWSEVSKIVASEQNCLGFYNRKVHIKHGNIIKFWHDMCIYKGYSILIRKNHPALKGYQENIIIDSLEKASDLIKHISSYYTKENIKGVVITMGGDTSFKLTNAPIIDEFVKLYFTLESVDNPDKALAIFKEGVGDLFIGGLPQRLVAKRYCIDIVSSQIHPLLFSINTLIYNKSLDENNSIKNILYFASKAWFEATSRLKTDDIYRKEVFSSIKEMLIKLGIAEHNLEEDGFNAVFGNLTKQDYEIFPSRPSDITDHVVSLIKNMFSFTINCKPDGVDKNVVDEFCKKILYQLSNLIDYNIK